MSAGAVPVRWFEFNHGWSQVDSEVIEENVVSIFVNGKEFVTIMATPKDLDLLAIGFLKNENLIDGLDDIVDVRVNPGGCCVDVWLNGDFRKPERSIITSGCGGGVTFDDPRMTLEPLESGLTVDPGTLYEIFNRLQTPTSLYARARGIHTAGLVSENRILVTAEDVGRHNSLDKLMGACLRKEIDPEGHLLLATGRVSSEMLRKSARMKCPIIASRNSPTSLSVEMARALNITLVGYVRRGGMRVYSHPERLGYAECKEKTDSEKGSDKQGIANIIRGN